MAAPRKFRQLKAEGDSIIAFSSSVVAKAFFRPMVLRTNGGFA